MKQCLIWRGLVVNGYGRIHAHGRARLAHHIAYERLHGPIPFGLTIDHLCSNKLCQNANHLEAVTLSVNTKRMWVIRSYINEQLRNHKQTIKKYGLLTDLGRKTYKIEHWLNN